MTFHVLFFLRPEWCIVVITAGNLMADNLQLVQMSTMLSAFLDDTELHHKAMHSRMQ